MKSQIVPVNRVEEMELAFFSEIQKITPTSWLSICLAYDSDRDDIVKQQKKLSSAMMDYVLTIYPENKVRDIRLAFNRQIAEQKKEYFLKLQELIDNNGEQYPLRSVAFEATTIALRSFIVLHDKIVSNNKTDVFVSSLRPFYGHVKLPEFDFSTKKKAFPKKSVSKTAIEYTEKNKESVFHLSFPDEYFQYNEDIPNYVKIVPRNWNKKNTSHESWHFSKFVNLECDFGGVHRSICPFCKKSLSHLITIPAISSLPFTGLKQCDIATCTGCLGWKVPSLFFRHSNKPSLMPLANGDYHDNPEIENVFIKPGKVHLCKTPENYFRQNWCDQDDENLHRIGGKPSWVQEEEAIICPECKKTMNFLLQIDSDLPTIDGKRWLWGSGGVLYVFWCDKCKIDGQMWQCS